MNAHVRAGLQSIVVEAVITRADGTVEDLGVIDEWHAPTPTNLALPIAATSAIVLVAALFARKVLSHGNPH